VAETRYAKRGARKGDAEEASRGVRVDVHSCADDAGGVAAAQEENEFTDDVQWCRCRFAARIVG
jgi:hypothetical protein